MLGPQAENSHASIAAEGEQMAIKTDVEGDDVPVEKVSEFLQYPEDEDMSK